MGCSGHKAADAVEVEHSESAARGQPTAMRHTKPAAHAEATIMKKVPVCDSPEILSEGSFDSVRRSSQSIISAASDASTTCSKACQRDELMNIAVLLDLEQSGVLTDGLSSSNPCVGSIAKVAKLRDDKDNSHISKGCEVAVNITGRRGKVLELLGVGRCLVRFEGHGTEVVMGLKDLHPLPESLQIAMRPTLSLPQKRLSGSSLL